MSTEPTCCQDAKRWRSVRLFVPASAAPSHWSVPLVNETGEAVKGGWCKARFCPFCGVALGRDHLAFEATALKVAADALESER